MIVAEASLRSLVKLYGKRIVYSDDSRIWYPEGRCYLLKLKHRCVHLLRKASLRDLFSTLRIEHNVFMTIILARA